MVIRRAHDGGRRGQRRVHVARVHEQRVASGLLSESADTRRAAVTDGAPGVHVTRSCSAPCIACHGFSATTPTKLFLTTTLTMSGKLADRALVDAHDGRADRRPHDTAMQHAGHAHVVHELELAGRHRAHVHARHWRAEHRPLARVLARRLIELHLELLPADESAVRHAS